jgi:hypothetical protein
MKEKGIRLGLIVFVCVVASASVLAIVWRVAYRREMTRWQPSSTCLINYSGAR